MCFLKKQELTGIKCIERILLSFKAMILIVTFAVILVITVFFLSNYFHKENKDTVTIDQGTLVGEESLDHWNETFYSFKGIPFAKPPISELRFKAPPILILIPNSMGHIISDCPLSYFNEEDIRVTINHASFYGSQSRDYLNGIFYSFQGIPFAKPPIGELRFKAPEAGEWCGPYDATKNRAICPQLPSPFSLNNGLEQSEDCLFLNIHTKMTPELKPVMVWIHGGSFIGGSIFEPTYGPEFLMSEDIVFVKVAYRLSIFGFCSVNDCEYDIPGNAGLKDQILALKWIQRNIHHFGGNPNQVTIFGQSAGGASVDLLSLSPLAKGLFHRAIAESGTALSLWIRSLVKYPELAKAIKCPLSSLDEIVNCLNESTTEKLLYGLGVLIQNVSPDKRAINLFNAFVIEKNDPRSFLMDEPEYILESENFSPVPMIIGFNTDDGEFLLHLNPYLQPNITDYRLLIPIDVNIDFSSTEAFDLGQKIKEFYYGTQTPSYDLLDPYIEFLTDVTYLEKIYKAAKLHSKVRKHSPIYFYEFDYYTKLSPQQYNTARNYVSHGAEIPYLFYHKGVTPENMNKSSEEYIAMHRMVKLWTTFAKTGDPNPENDPLLNVKWLPIESDNFNYFKISQNLELKQNPARERMRFWEQIYKEFNLKLC